jgi:guanylate kinase
MLKAICLVGPSGSGKTALSEKAHKMCTFGKVKTATTRKPRPLENEDAYFFCSEQEFKEKMKKGEFLETTTYAGCLYGTPISSIETIVDKGQIALVPIDINGAMKYKEYFGNDVCIVFVQRNKKDVIQSIIERDIPVSEKSRRIMQLDEEYKLIDCCDKCIVNNGTLEESLNTLILFAK